METKIAKLKQRKVISGEKMPICMENTSLLHNNANLSFVFAYICLEEASASDNTTNEARHYDDLQKEKFQTQKI